MWWTILNAYLIGILIALMAGGTLFGIMLGFEERGTLHSTLSFSLPNDIPELLGYLTMIVIAAILWPMSVPAVAGFGIVMEQERITEYYKTAKTKFIKWQEAREEKQLQQQRRNIERNSVLIKGRDVKLS